MEKCKNYKASRNPNVMMRLAGNCILKKEKRNQLCPLLALDRTKKNCSDFEVKPSKR